MCLISRFNRHFSRTFVTVFPLIDNFTPAFTLQVKDVRAQKFPRTDFFKTLTVENDKIRLKT